MARRNRIVLTIVSPDSSMVAEIGGLGPERKDPREGDFERAYVAMRLIMGLPMREQDVALFEASKSGRKAARRG